MPWRTALEAAEKQNWSFAKRVSAGIKDPLIPKIVHWMYITESKAPVSFQTVKTFIDQNPDWPLIAKMRLRAEEAISDKLSAQERIRWFDEHPPQTVHGVILYVDALIDRNKRKTAQTFLKKFWLNGRIDTPQMKKLKSKYYTLLSPEDHAARLDNLIWSERYEEARDVLPMTDHDTRAVAKARLALATESGGVDQAIQNVPTHLQNDSGLVFERLAWRRRHDRNIDALEILNNPPKDLGPHPRRWWQERHIMARRAMENKDFELAYILTSAHQQTRGFEFAQAEFLSGWLALQHLNKPRAAFDHFYKLYNNVSTPISKARGAYWAAMAAKAMKQDDVSTQWLEDAAQHRTTFYGQLAEQTLGYKVTSLSGFTYKPTAKEKTTFERDELVRALRLLHTVGADRKLEPFLEALSLKAKTLTDHAMVATLALELGDYYTAVSLAKDAHLRGVVLFDEGYPLLPPLPTNKPDPALVHAIIRQESMFNTFAVSYAGARGLMQLMPGTAKEVARRLRTRYSSQKLTHNPKHNVHLGSVYLQQLLEKYDGHYVLAIAAYNAGPGRVDRWIEELGDPRHKDVNIIDWIETIPVYQTRNYVQRVMEGFYVYRIRMSAEPEILLAQNQIIK